MPEPTVGVVLTTPESPDERRRCRMALMPCARLFALWRFSLTLNARNVMNKHSNIRTRLMEVR
jgi:hypothetical protein